MFQPMAVNLKPIPIAAYPPVRRRMAQLVTVNPNVQVQVNTGIEQYLFPVGLMLAGGASFIVGTAVPKGFKSATTIAGVGLIAAGAGVLIYRGMKSKAAAPAAPSPAGAVPVSSDASPPAFTPPPSDAFRALQLVIVSPQSGQQLSSVGGILGFLGIGQKSFPVQLRMYNPSSVDVTFNMDFAWDEYPSLGGYDRGHYSGSKSYQVSLGAGEQKNQTFDLPVRSDVSWSQIQVDLQMYTRRTPQETQQLLGNLTFTVV